MIEEKDRLAISSLFNKDKDDHMEVLGGVLAFGISGYLFAVIGLLSGHTLQTVMIIALIVFGTVLTSIAVILIIHRLSVRKKLNHLSSLIVSSKLSLISDIVHHSGISEKKVIKHLRILVSDSSSHKLGNDAHYLKGAQIDLQSMEVILSDKYVKKEPWTCVYCRAVNEAVVLTCQSCQAPKKKV